MTEIESPPVESTPTAAGTTTIKPLREARPTFASISTRVAALRDEVELTNSDVTELHQETMLGALDERTTLIAVRDPHDLLDELSSDWGLSWSTMARLIGVTGTAIRKWRRGEQLTPQNRRRVARLYAFLEMLRDRYPIADPASWLEMHISDGATVTPADLYVANRQDLLFELAGHRLTSHDVLGAFDPEWRSRYSTDERFEVIEAPDGELSIVEKPRSG